MLKIFKNRNKLNLVLEGTVEIDYSKIKSYEIYLKEQEKLQLRQIILNYVESILKNPYASGSYFINSAAIDAYNEAIQDLTDYLINHVIEERVD